MKDNEAKRMPWEKQEFCHGDIVAHFKRELVDKHDLQKNRHLYTYIVLDNNVIHTETGERLVICKALYGKEDTIAMPYEEFYGKVNKRIYPEIKQENIFESFYLIQRKEQENE